MPTDVAKTGRCHQPLKPRSHQTICLVLAVKLLGIMWRNRCWSTTFRTITSGDAHIYMVTELAGVYQPHMLQSHQTFGPVPIVKMLEIMCRSRGWPTTFHTITTTDADRWCQDWLV